MYRELRFRYNPFNKQLYEFSSEEITLLPRIYAAALQKALRWSGTAVNGTVKFLSVKSISRK